MPHSPLHKIKLKKNLAVGGAIIAFIALFWVVTMIRISANTPQTSQQSPLDTAPVSGKLETGE